MESQYKRETAYKCKTSELINNTFIRNDGNEPNYVSINNKKVGRVNIIGTIVDKNSTEKIVGFKIDDGFGNISSTFFEDLDYLKENFKIGDCVIVVGRVNDFNGIKLNGEIIKKLDRKWFEFRKKELMKETNEINNESQQKSNEDKQNNFQKISNDDEEIDLSSNNKTESPYQIVWKLIKEKDSGFGVDFDTLKENIEIEDSKIEDICHNLVKEGEIYEIKPGYYKVLE